MSQEVVFLIGGEHVRHAMPPALQRGARRVAQRRVAGAPSGADTGATASVLHKLRPRKIRNAIRRRWFEWRLSRHRLPALTGLVDLGSKPGGWTVPGDMIAEDWCCYCVGAGGDVSFDVELMRRFGVTVRSFDPVAGYLDLARREVGPELPFSAHLAALATEDGPIRMQLTHHPGSRSLSSDGLYESRRYIECPGRTLATLMAEMGDGGVDLLKVDIEGAEYRVVPELDLAGSGVRVLSVQLHHNGGVRRARRLIAGLRESGYELVACRPAVKLTFVRSELLPTT
jgi:FkbM family methyltransferase